MASSPRINTQLERQTLELRRKARLPVHRPSACSGVKALRNTSDARRQAATVRWGLRCLTPSARSGDLIAGDGTKNGLFRSEQKTVSTTQNNRLTGKAPYKSAPNFTAAGRRSEREAHVLKQRSGHQVVTAIRRLQPFRYLHDCSDCFRLERIAGWALHPLQSAALSRRTP